jgi:hypothetical protein
MKGARAIGLGLLLIGTVTSLVSCASSGATRQEKDIGMSSTEKAALPADPFSGIQLPAPKTAEARDYLGIGDADPFSLGDIDTQILIIEVFSMYCPHCQREAPNVNRLFDQIVDRSDLKEKIKMIGIGVGNNDYEIDIFRKTYDIAFPLFADPSMEISKTLKAERTPTFIAIAYDEAPMLKQVYFQVGNMADGDLFLKEIIERSGLPIASGQ